MSKSIDPTEDRQISFLEALTDEEGSIKKYYILQYVFKNKNVYNAWKEDPFNIPFVPNEVWNAAIDQFESDKVHYLETGELPEE